MDKNLFIFILIGLGALYFVTDFVGKIQEKDEIYRINRYIIEHQYAKYQNVDSVGRPILVVNNADEKVQIEAWNFSALKVEFLALFPNYLEMKKFTKERIRGEYLQKRLILIINDVEGKFYSGEINTEQAKRMLDSVKAP